jgi:hypothetical protein
MIAGGKGVYRYESRKGQLLYCPNVAWEESRRFPAADFPETDFVLILPIWRPIHDCLLSPSRVDQVPNSPLDSLGEFPYTPN